MIGPDGKPAILFTCHYGIGGCFELLAARCRAGYEILAKAEQQHSTSMVVRCRKP